jgi:hypothetical protein
VSSTNEKATPKSTSAEPVAVDAVPQTLSPDVTTHPGDDDFSFPTETEIYILPNGQVVFADLPVELIDLAEKLGSGSS